MSDDRRIPTALVLVLLAMRLPSSTFTKKVGEILVDYRNRIVRIVRRAAGWVALVEKRPSEPDHGTTWVSATGEVIRIAHEHEFTSFDECHGVFEKLWPLDEQSVDDIVAELGSQGLTKEEQDKLAEVAEHLDNALIRSILAEARRAALAGPPTVESKPAELWPRPVPEALSPRLHGVLELLEEDERGAGDGSEIERLGTELAHLGSQRLEQLCRACFDVLYAPERLAVLTKLAASVRLDSEFADVGQRPQSRRVPTEPGWYVVLSKDVGLVDEWGPLLAGERPLERLVFLLEAWRSLSDEDEEAMRDLPRVGARMVDPSSAEWNARAQRCEGLVRMEPFVFREMSGVREVVVVVLTEDGRAVLELSSTLDRTPFPKGGGHAQ